MIWNGAPSTYHTIWSTGGLTTTLRATVESSGGVSGSRSRRTPCSGDVMCSATPSKEMGRGPGDGGVAPGVGPRASGDRALTCTGGGTSPLDKAQDAYRGGRSTNVRTCMCSGGVAGEASNPSRVSTATWMWASQGWTGAVPGAKCSSTVRSQAFVASCPVREQMRTPE